jgi:hypothetical protein
VFEKRVQRRTLVRKREAVVRGWRRLHCEELHNLYASPGIIRAIKSRIMGWARHTARTGEMRNADKILVRKPAGMKQLGGRTRRWEDNIIADLNEIWWESSDRIHLAQDRDQWRAVVKTVMNVRLPQDAGNFLTS